MTEGFSAFLGVLKFGFWLSRWFQSSTCLFYFVPYQVFWGNSSQFDGRMFAMFAAGLKPPTSLN